MLGRLSIFLSVFVALLVSGCQCGTWRCRSEPWSTPHSINAGMTNCGGCGIASCTSCSGLGGRMVGSVGCTDGGACGTAGCHSCGGAPRGPLEHLRQLTRSAICGSGCGDIYIGEWISDPPDCCDPCNDFGYWSGYQGSCPPRRGWYAFWNRLMGVRHQGNCGCSDCTTAGFSHSMHGYEYEVMPGPGSESIDLPNPPNDGGSEPPSPMPEVSNQQTRHIAPGRQGRTTVAHSHQPVGSGVRRANYQR